MTGLPDWAEPLPDAAMMRATDRWAIDERGIPSLDLMERAGGGLARVAAERAASGRVVVVCGPGNNGGDGFVAGRLLRAAGREVDVVVAGPRDAYQGDALANLRRLDREPAPFAAAALDGATLVIDALLGTGVAGAPRPSAAAIIDAVNASPAQVVAADIPSGVDASTGEVAGSAVRAAATVTFVQSKPGLWIHPGKACAGAVSVIDIGIPAGAPVHAGVGRIGTAVLASLGRRDAAGTKFTSGHVLVVGGSRGLTGAPCLTARAAARGGAGYVTAMVPEELEAIVATKLTEVMNRGLPSSGGGHTPAGAAAVIEAAAARGGVVVLGPGLGRSPEAQAFARRVVAGVDVPVVLDADGLNAHAGHVTTLAGRPAATILTPHAGELARLLEVDSAEVAARRLWHVREAVRLTGAVVVLKGDDTIVGGPGGMAVVNSVAAPMLATAGTGDVLAGLIGALLARNGDPFTTAAAAVRLHALAGRCAAEEHGAEAVIASDVVEALGRARDRAPG